MVVILLNSAVGMSSSERLSNLPKGVGDWRGWDETPGQRTPKLPCDANSPISQAHHLGENSCPCFWPLIHLNPPVSRGRPASIPTKAVQALAFPASLQPAQTLKPEPGIKKQDQCENLLGAGGGGSGRGAQAGRVSGGRWTVWTRWSEGGVLDTVAAHCTALPPLPLARGDPGAFMSLPCPAPGRDTFV